MSMFTPAQIMERYSAMGKVKAERSVHTLLILSFLAGFLIAAAAMASSTVAFQRETVSQARLASGLIFPFGLGMVMVTGAELFTGNTMLLVSLLERKVRLMGLLRSWGFVLFGNFCGAVFMAILCGFSGLFQTSGGAFGVYFIRIAAEKCALPFANALVLGILCNLLVCIGVLCSLSAEDTAGRILGAYIPIALFIICGFEHSIANFFYIPAGFFAARQPDLANLATTAGIDISGLTLTGFLDNILPVTLGNTIGGAGIGLLMWMSHKQKV